MSRGNASSTEQDELAGVFEERAEHLSRERLENWSADFPHDSLVLRKLTGTGAKLLIGPRGSGKSTLLRRAYFSLVSSGAAMPVYVNYSKSLALEPLFHRRSDALAVFRQWVLNEDPPGRTRVRRRVGEDQRWWRPLYGVDGSAGLHRSLGTRGGPTNPVDADCAVTGQFPSGSVGEGVWLRAYRPLDG